MAEAAAGIVLGAVTIIVPIYKSYKRCAELLQDILHPTEDLKSFTVKFITQKRFFEMECELLLSSAVGNETAQRMLEEEQHQQWKDQNFIEWCEANVSGPLEMALKTSMETLKEISKRLAQGNSSKGAMTTSSVRIVTAALNTLTF
jgi:hypothetical protein